MLKLLFPHEYVGSVFDIDYKKVFDMGYRGILFDIDNTLVPHGSDSTEKVDDLLRRIQSMGFKILLLSNNSEERIVRFLANIDALYIHDAQKPDLANYLKAIEMLQVRKEEALCIGDQVFTDIYGANKCGIDNILVAYIRAADETKIGIRRNLEKIVLKFYKMNASYQNRIGDIHAKEYAKDVAEQKQAFL